MRVDGKTIADSILDHLTAQTAQLKKRGITPTLAVVLIGDDPGSLSYIGQKTKAAERIGAHLLFEHLPAHTSVEILASTIAHFNNESAVHGLIIQRPVPETLGDVQDILVSVTPAKDVDGLLPNSPFQIPVARGVITILQHIHAELLDKSLIRQEFIPWLTAQSIAIVGRGETAGKPIAALLERNGCATSVVHSQTQNPEQTLRNASIIVSCVGKKEVVTKHHIKPGVILISVGLWRDSEGKLHGDYEEDVVKNIASFYTPTPGGVGPVNVACLMQNLLDACSLQNPHSYRS